MKCLHGFRLNLPGMRSGSVSGWFVQQPVDKGFKFFFEFLIMFSGTRTVKTGMNFPYIPFFINNDGCRECLDALQLGSVFSVRCSSETATPVTRKGYFTLYRF